MKPVDFLEKNIVFAKDQPEYMPLPAYIRKDGEMTCCWQLTWKERLMLLITGKLWHSILTFHQALQPQILSINKPNDMGG